MGGGAELQQHVGNAFRVEGLERPFLDALRDDPRKRRCEQCHRRVVDAVEEHEVLGPEQRLEQHPALDCDLDLALARTRHERVEARERIEARLFKHILDLRQGAPREPIGQRLEQRLLGGKVVIERALRYAGLRDHVVEARIVVAARQEQRLRAVEELAAAQLRVFDDAGHPDPRCLQPGKECAPRRRALAFRIA